MQLTLEQFRWARDLSVPADLQGPLLAIARGTTGTKISPVAFCSGLIAALAFVQAAYKQYPYSFLRKFGLPLHRTSVPEGDASPITPFLVWAEVGIDDCSRRLGLDVVVPPDQPTDAECRVYWLRTPPSDLNSIHRGGLNIPPLFTMSNDIIRLMQVQFEGLTPAAQPACYLGARFALVLAYKLVVQDLTAPVRSPYFRGQLITTIESYAKAAIHYLPDLERPRD